MEILEWNKIIDVVDFMVCAHRNESPLWLKFIKGDFWIIDNIYYE